jgi:hypothetical protein
MGIMMYRIIQDIRQPPNYPKKKNREDFDLREVLEVYAVG